MFLLLLRSLEFAFYHYLLTIVDRISRLPRNTTMPEAERLYRENIALKAQLDAYESDMRRTQSTKPKRQSLRMRAAQVFAYLLTRDDEPFRRYFLTAPISTIQRWLSKFRRRKHLPVPAGGRPSVSEEVVQLILTLKRESRSWGQRRIREELRRMGVRVAEATIRKILLEHGFSPHPHRKLDFERFKSAAKDAVWAIDYFAVRTAKNKWVQVLIILDIFTRERIDFRVYDGWDVDSWWTTRAFYDAIVRTKRRPAKVISDHGTHFMGQFERQLRVLEIEQDRTVTGLPSLNCYVECAIGTCRRELLRHIRCADADELQRYLDQYRDYANDERAHQGLGGQSPTEVSGGSPRPKLLNLDELKQKRLVRREYACGILHGYSLQDAA
ncbi:MAG: transposase [Myxococcales bacterium]